MQYGQSVEEFWHGEPALFEAREIAYYKDVSMRGFIYGRYMYDAFQTGLYNALRDKKPPRDYIKEPMELIEDTREVYRRAKQERLKAQEKLKESRQLQAMTGMFAQIENRYGRE